MKNIFLSIICALALAVGNGASAQDEPAEEHVQPALTANDEGYVLKRYPEKFADTTLQCVFIRNLHDWQALNRYNLIIWAPSRNNPYHVELDFPCHNLRFAETIAFSDENHDDRVCGFGGDSVLVPHSGEFHPGSVTFAGDVERCPIGRITKLSEEGVERLREQAPGMTRKQIEKMQKEASE